MLETISSIDDPRVAAYRHVRDRTARGESLFIAEGILLVERLLESRYDVESVLATPAHREHLQKRLPPEIPLYEGEPELLREIVGFPFHRGALAAGRRRPVPSLDQLVAPLSTHRATLLGLPEIKTPDNLGLICRAAAALGADALILGPGSCDPLSRRCLRLSMGACLTVPFTMVDDFTVTVETLQRRHDFQTVATVLDPSARPLDTFAWPARTLLLLGNEYYGLPDQVARTADHRVTISMQHGTDSLNVAVAAGIFLHAAMLSRRDG